ncbi:MAG: phosphatase PAP2 family protein [Prevotella sp.]|nr:phosphatase PAP2 family protein [Prevotella sp.]
MEELINMDKQLLLMINGSDSSFVDNLILILTNAKTWIPLYIGLAYVVCRVNRDLRSILLIIGGAALCVLLAGGVDDMIVKPLVARWRPTHDPEIGSMVDVVDGYRGGNYGFFSAHAANTFSIAIYISLLMRQRLLTLFMVAWSLTNCYTRLYLGVHYPGDICVGLIWGGLVGYSVYRFYYCRLAVPASYPLRLCYIPMAILLLTILAAVTAALFLT